MVRRALFGFSGGRLHYRPHRQLYTKQPNSLFYSPSQQPLGRVYRFAIIGVIGLGLNELIMYCAVELIGLHYMVAKLISTALVFFWNFFARKMTLFYKQPNT